MNADDRRKMEQRIEYIPEYRLARRMIEVMSEDYGLSDDVSVVFRNRRASCVTDADARRATRFIVVYGYQFLRDASRHGNENHSFGYMFGSARGLRAVWTIAIHEFAHVVNIAENWTRGHNPDSHGSGWTQKIRELSELYPFEEMEQYAHPWTETKENKQ